MKKVRCVVVCYWGAHDDYTESNEMVFDTKEAAEAYISKQDQRYVKYRIDEVPTGDE